MEEREGGRQGKARDSGREGCREGGKIGQISYVYAKEGKLFVHLYFLEITANSKLIKKYTNIELFGKEMEKLTELTEAEYQGEFFAYVNKRIRIVETG